jgi:DNA-binding IclR family transcriptional regulator
MEHLAASTGARVVASAVAGEEIVMLAVAGEERPFGTALRAGQRLPLAPPIGTVFLAWAGEDAVHRWLERREASDADRHRWRGSLVAVRRRGFCVALDSAARHLLAEAVSAGSAPTGLVTDLDHGEYVLVDLRSDREYAVSVIAAPVFGDDGSVAMALTLFDLPDQLSAARVVELAEALLHSTTTITKELRNV